MSGLRAVGCGLWAVVALLLAPGVAQATDLNCNGIEFNAEDVVDLDDSICSSMVGHRT